jgi:hypothetical protein
MSTNQGRRIFGLSEWEAWLNSTTLSLFGMVASEFELAYDAGTLVDSGNARNVSSVLPLIRGLRVREMNR